MKKILGIVLAFVMLVTVLAIIPAASDVAQGDGYYVYLDEGITLVHVSGGEEYRIPVAAKDIAKFPELEDGSTSDYSVHTYLDKLLEKGQPKFMADLMTALLNYGAAAQQYFGEAGELAGTPVTNTADLKAATAPKVDVKDDEGIYIGASLLLTGTIQLRFYFMGTDVTTNYGKATNPAGKGYSYIDVPVMPYDMSKSVTVTVGTTSVTYAPINYLKNQADNPELSTMVASIYAYGAKAYEYKNHEHIYNGVITLPATCAPGVKTFTCNYCDACYTEAIAPIRDHTYFDDTSTARYIITKVGEEYVKADYCTSCKDWVSYGNYDNYKNDLSAAKQKLESTTISGSTNLSSSSWGSSDEKYNNGSYTISAYPTTDGKKLAADESNKGEHPRLLVNTEVLANIKNKIGSGNKEMIDLLRTVAYLANRYDSKRVGGDLVGGNLGSADHSNYANNDNLSGTHNYNSYVLETIMSKAFLYLYTGADYYAIEATRWMKQYLKTLRINSDVPDCERYWGYAMFAAAIVYDWCYNSPYVEAADKEDLVEGIKNIAKGSGHMEIGFPPSKQGAVCGHGSERQLLRDYLAVALAIYDEYPGWYEYIGGRFFEEFVPVRNEFYKSGMYPQGISVYVGIRFESDLWSAWLMQSATGYNPYDLRDENGNLLMDENGNVLNNQQKVIRSVFSRVVDGKDYYFDEGDDQTAATDKGYLNLRRYAVPAKISAYLYNDPTAAAWGEGAWLSASEQSDWQKWGDSFLYQIIYRSTGVDNNKNNRYKGLDLILYNGGFMNEIVAHNGWDKNSVSVLMKIGGRTTANHDHADAGSFQIYYKGMLAGDTGFYDSYDDDPGTQFREYHQATIAHNSIVIYKDNTSYGQKPGCAYSEPKTYDEWMSDSYKTATLIGVSTKYDLSGNPQYAYIAGDITPAYTEESSSASYVERRMLSVFNTENKDAPMYFFVYDRVKTGESYQAAFLLHTLNEPQIEGNTVTVTSGGNNTGGKLVLQSLIGASEFKTYSGEQKYYVNGESYTATDDGYWGRVEIKTAKSNDHTMLNVIYVTDAGKTLSLPATGFDFTVNNSVEANGAAIGNTVAVFLKSTSSNTTSYSGGLTFTAPDTGAGTKVNYYISGMAAGKYTIECNGQVIRATVDEKEGILVFNTFAGEEVKITKGHNSDSSGSSDNELPWDEWNNSLECK